MDYQEIAKKLMKIASSLTEASNEKITVEIVTEEEQPPSQKLMKKLIKDLKKVYDHFDLVEDYAIKNPKIKSDGNVVIFIELEFTGNKTALKRLEDDMAETISDIIDEFYYKEEVTIEDIAFDFN